MNAQTAFLPDIRTGEDSNAFAEIAADLFISCLEAVENPLVVLPTGHTPLDMYRMLVTRHGHRRNLWDRMRFLALDEYIGLPPGDPRLLYGWLRKEFLDRIGHPESARTIFYSDTPDPAAEAARIDLWLQQNGPIDLAVLGLGTNGHIAFNEPGSPFDEPAHVVLLTPETIAANAAYWGSAERVPKMGMTLGLGNLAAARRTLLLVTGAHKAAILDRVLHESVDPALPATYLRTIPGVSIVTDRAARCGRPPC